MAAVQNVQDVSQVENLFDQTLPKFILENKVPSRAKLELVIRFKYTDGKSDLIDLLRAEHQLPPAFVRYAQSWDILALTVELQPNEWGRLGETYLERFMGARCIFCLTDVTKDDTVVCLPCSHLFHESCMVEWWNTGRSQAVSQCPTCKQVYTEWHIGEWIGWRWTRQSRE